MAKLHIGHSVQKDGKRGVIIDIRYQHSANGGHREALVNWDHREPSWVAVKSLKPITFE